MRTEVVVIGGGATGAGVLRDLALRGIEAVLLEKNELVSGTSGRNHGLLHSGARYAITDPVSARECLNENFILKKIASPCIETTDGYFLSLPQDPPDYPQKLIRACAQLGLPAKELPVADVLHKEPAVSPRIQKAFSVPDAAIDPFRLIRSNLEEAEQLGAKIFPHRQVMAILGERGSIRGLQARDRQTGEDFLIQCRFIINAAGIWSGQIAGMAGATLEMVYSKGSLIVLNQRLVNSVVNRCRPPANGDILVPHGPALIIGTTAQPVRDLEDPAPDPAEIDLLLSEGEKVIPQISHSRAIRAYSGIRPLMGAGEFEEDIRKVSRDFLLVDHGEVDQIEGFFSIIGGKLTTYRLMAERTVDALCKKMGHKNPCRTAEKPLPFPSEYSFGDAGSKLRRIAESKGYPESEQILCECELVSKSELLHDIQHHAQVSFQELQQRTRAGMGPCQGGFCSHRLLALLSEAGKIPPGTSLNVLKCFLEERWKGICPVLWGSQLKEEQLIQALYAEFFNLDHI